MEGAISNEIRRVHWWKKGSVVIFISIPKVDWDRAYGKDIAIKTDAMKSLNKGAVGKGRGKAGLKYVNGIWELKALGAAGDIRTLIGHGARCRTIAGIRIIDITLHYVKEGTRRLH
ncbi:hypothetical protein EBR96_09385 [bacterium]|nr:hypothetical protein [bacterium]